MKFTTDCRKYRNIAPNIMPNTIPDAPISKPTVMKIFSSDFRDAPMVRNMAMSRVLARTSGQVTMVCRSALSAKREYLDKLDARENLRFIWDSEVAEVLGDMKLGGVRLRNVKDGSLSDLECEGLFPFIGVVPNTAAMPAALLGPSGHVIAPADCRTDDPRIFAAGAVRADYGGNAVEAMAEGVRAASAAAALLGRIRV